METTKRELIVKAKAFINDAILLLNVAIYEDSKVRNLKITISTKDKHLVLDNSLDELIESYKDDDKGMDGVIEQLNGKHKGMDLHTNIIALLNIKGHQE